MPECFGNAGEPAAPSRAYLHRTVDTLPYAATSPTAMCGWLKVFDQRTVLRPVTLENANGSRTRFAPKPRPPCPWSPRRGTSCGCPWSPLKTTVQLTPGAERLSSQDRYSFIMLTYRRHVSFMSSEDPSCSRDKKPPKPIAFTASAMALRSMTPSPMGT